MYFDLTRKWWDRHGWGVIFFGSLIVLFILWFFYSRHRVSGTSNTTWDQILQTIFKPTPAPVSNFQSIPRIHPPKNMSKGETICKEFMEFVTKKPFQKIRPPFLVNPVTKHPLELDLYNEELRLAIEYNGSQHYEFNPMMHPTRDSFHNQKYRDLIKKQLCDQQGIRLISVPYTVPHDKIPLFLYEQLKLLNII